MKVICAYCKKEADLRTGDVNRAKKLGVPIYCNRVCAGLGRRVNRTEEEKKKIKSDYDRERLNGELREKILKQRSDYAKTEAGRISQKKNRDNRTQQHLEYCRTEEYRAWKRNYDEKYCAKKNYGEFWEAAIVLKTIDEIILPEKKECKIQKGTYNKSQKRKRLWNSRPRI